MHYSKTRDLIESMRQTGAQQQEIDLLQLEALTDIAESLYLLVEGLQRG